MKAQLIAASLLLATLGAPIAMADPQNCGKPQGYGTSNPYPFNAGSTSAVRIYSDNVALGATTAKKPQGYGTNNPFVFNSGRTREEATGN